MMKIFYQLQNNADSLNNYKFDLQAHCYRLLYFLDQIMQEYIHHYQ